MIDKFFKFFKKSKTISIINFYFLTFVKVQMNKNYKQESKINFLIVLSLNNFLTS